VSLCVDLAEMAAAETVAIIRDEGNEVIALSADVTDLAFVEVAVAAAMDAFGAIDILHNNVGVTHMGGPVELDEDKFQAGPRPLHRTGLPHRQGGVAACAEGRRRCDRQYLVARRDTLRCYPFFSYCATKADRCD
jgi:NAD(P)-dependent dehydrogenase (short-subunit alcohol dehydrogenase family)